VTIADVDKVNGARLASELSGKAQFVECNVTIWEDQVNVFELAKVNSPHKSCDIVIANAGISGPDPFFALDDISKPPVKPNLRIIDVDLIGVIYTSKLAMHYFRMQPEDIDRDRCLIIKGSMAGFLDQPGSPQYNVAKFGGRALMRCLRRTSWQQGIRINYVAPWYIKTPIMSDAVVKRVESKGVKFALQADACKAVIHLASDKTLNGRSVAIVPREINSEGYMDAEHDDYPNGDFLKPLQELVLQAAHRVAVPANEQ